MSVAVIGAGVSGLTAARHLQQHGISVSVFEKSRGLGGRCATRRFEKDDISFSFDHGAQYFTARSPQFQAEIAKMQELGSCVEWKGQIRIINENQLLPQQDHENLKRFVATPGMSAIGRFLGQGITHIKSNCRISAIERLGDKWCLKSDDGSEQGCFSHVIISTPAEQAAILAPPATADLKRRIGTKHLAPCWAVLVAFSKKIDAPFDAAFVNNNSVISWISRDSSKPNRPRNADCWVVHTTRSFSVEHLENNPTEISHLVWDAFSALPVGLPASLAPSVCLAHRWRFSIPESADSDELLFDSVSKVGFCGDWASAGARVEGAYLSGLRLAERLVDDIKPSKM